MGRDKAGLPFRGATLAEYIAREVSEAAGSATLVGNPAIGIPDLHPGEGPLGGILTALTHTTAEWNLIVACDMPGVGASFLRRLLQAARDRDADALLPHGPSGFVEPLCAVYHRCTLAAIRAQFDAGTRKVTTALKGLALATLKVAEVAQFQNVNTPEDWIVHAGE
jgi:molybdopterin-guanine dinucleotide biosynthesis protein A